MSPWNQILSKRSTVVEFKKPFTEAVSCQDATTLSSRRYSARLKRVLLTADSSNAAFNSNPAAASISRQFLGRQARTYPSSSCISVPPVLPYPTLQIGQHIRVTSQCKLISHHHCWNTKRYHSVLLAFSSSNGVRSGCGRCSKRPAAARRREGRREKPWPASDGEEGRDEVRRSLDAQESPPALPELAQGRGRNRGVDLFSVGVHVNNVIGSERVLFLVYIFFLWWSKYVRWHACSMHRCM